jgi:uncharacterized membrane protein YGL010W
LVAPFFAVVEVMFFLGWRKDLMARCQKKIDINIAEYRRTRNASKSK